MKKLILTSILAVLVAAGTTARVQDRPDEYLGLPGDNLNLYAVMNLFQESETLEGFERSLNDENSRINNLDLNGDNFIDYITVSDYVDRNVHTIVLRVALNRQETQDVAVFTVQKFNNGTAQIQLIGDEALYGRNYIIEPNYAETPNPGYVGTGSYNVEVVRERTPVIHISLWPVVSYIFNPGYRVWYSSWYWGYYPTWWSPWRPYYYHYYYGYHSHWFPHYYKHYRLWNHIRYARYENFYYKKMRSYSPLMAGRIREGHFRDTYSRPDQRKNGEALYTRLHADRNGRIDNNASGSRGRNSIAQSSRDRNNSTVRTEARKNNPGTVDRAAARNSGVQRDNATARRSSPTVSGRSSTQKEVVRNNDRQGRSSATAASRNREVSEQRSSKASNSQAISRSAQRTSSSPEASVSSARTERSAANAGRTTSARVAKQQSSTSSKSAAAVTGRSASRSDSRATYSRSERSTPAVTGKAARSSSSQREVTSRSSGNPRSAAPSVSRSSRNSSSSPDMARSGNSKSSESANPSRRR